MTLLNDIVAKVPEMKSIGARYDFSNSRVLGSVARQEDDLHSDIDILVDAGPLCTLLSIVE